MEFGLSFGPLKMRLLLKGQLAEPPSGATPGRVNSASIARETAGPEPRRHLGGDACRPAGC
ncbi:hypothetical protein O4J55_28260, partial [Paracoccus sp. PXZ]